MISKQRMWRFVAAMGVAGAACWLGGLVWFTALTRHPDETPPPHTDGIVALTGGAGRVELALRLLARDQADRLLLSGIGGGTDLATLGRRAGVDTEALANRITVGRFAGSTQGNGIETAAWAEQNRIASLIVVTAAYHMPRALAELREAVPDVRLFPMSVLPSAVAEKGPGLRLEAEEYTKYLLAASGLSAWFPHRAVSGASGPAGLLPGRAPGGPPSAGG